MVRPWGSQLLLIIPPGMLIVFASVCNPWWKNRLRHESFVDRCTHLSLWTNLLWLYSDYAIKQCKLFTFFSNMCSINTSTNLQGNAYFFLVHPHFSLSYSLVTWRSIAKHINMIDEMYVFCGKNELLQCLRPFACTRPSFHRSHHERYYQGAEDIGALQMPCRWRIIDWARSNAGGCWWSFG